MKFSLRLPDFATSTLWNLGGTALPLAVGLLLIPATLHGMGEEAFGILTLLWAAIGYFSLFDFGLGRALTQMIAAERSQQATLSGGLLGTGLIGALVPGVLGGLLLWVLTPYLVYNALNISAPLQAQALGAFRLAAVSIPLVTLGSGMRGALEGFENFKQSALIRGLLGLLNFVGPWLLVVHFDGGLVAVAWALLLARLLSLLQNGWYLRQYDWAEGTGVFDRTLWKRLLGFGSWMTLSNMVGPLMVTVDRYFLAAWLGAALVAYYTVPQDMVVRLLMVPAALTTTLFPRFATYWKANQQEEVTKRMAKSARTLALLMGMLVLFLAVVAKPALAWWLSPAFAAEAFVPTVVLLMGIFFNSLGLLPLTALQAAGFYDDNPSLASEPGFQGPLSAMNALAPDTAVLLTATSPAFKEKWLAHSPLPLRYPNAIHRRATLGTSVQLGQGNIISEGCILTTDITLGAFNALNHYVTIGHHSRIGSGNALMTKAHLSRHVSLGNHNLLAVGSSILQGKGMGNGNTLGPHACLMNNVGHDQTYLGVPALAVQ